MSGTRRSLYIGDEQWTQLTERAEREDRSVAWLVRQAIDAHLRSGIVPPNAKSDTPPSVAPPGALEPGARLDRIVGYATKKVKK